MTQQELLEEPKERYAHKTSFTQACSFISMCVQSERKRALSSGRSLILWVISLTSLLTAK